MPSIYVSEETKEKLIDFIRKSRLSPIIGSPSKFKNPNEAIDFLLKIGLKYRYEILEGMLKQPFVSGEMPYKDRKDVLRKKFAEVEENGS